MFFIKTVCSNIKFLQNYFVVTLDILEVLGGNRRVLDARSRSGFDGFFLLFVLLFGELVC